MSSFKDYIKKHIPETVCVLVTACIFIVMSVYAICLYAGMVSQDENTFEEINNPVSLTEKYETETAKESVYDGEYYTVGKGTKYHTSDCSYVKSSTKAAVISWEQIEEKGYQPCSKCIK